MADDEDPVMTALRKITSRDCRSLRESWTVLNHPDKRLEHGQLLFFSIIRSYPHTKALFRNCENKSEEEMKQIPKFNVSSKQVINKLDDFLKVIDKPDRLISRITELTVKHKKYRVYEAHFKFLKEVFDEYLRIILKDSFRDEYAQAWGKFLDIVIAIAKKTDEQHGISS